MSNRYQILHFAVKLTQLRPWYCILYSVSRRNSAGSVHSPVIDSKGFPSVYLAVSLGVTSLWKPVRRKPRCKHG